MRYDTQIIYGDTNKATFSKNGWTYYKTPSGKTKRRESSTGKIESVNPELWESLKVEFEKIFGYFISE